MLTITDKAAIDAIYQAKQPRPIREVMLDIYPDATEDSNGRFHAPHDGYLCPITGLEYRGGEYLPMEEDENNDRIYFGGSRKYPTGVDLDGNLHKWEGTRAQLREVWGELIRQSRAYDAATSQHLGTVGDKLVIDCHMEHVHSFEGYYGRVYINIIKSGGNVIIYKGSKELMPKGHRFTLTAKVKEHGERDGVKQTVVWRPKAVPLK